MAGELRDRMLGKAASFASKIVEIEGEKVEVRQPTVGGRAAILAAAGMADEKTAKDIGKLQVFAVLHCCFDPADGKPLFQRADVPRLEGLPAGSWLDDLSAAAIELMNVQPAEDAKNLGGTPDDSSSTP